MSTPGPGAPFVAPWATEFNTYPVQLLTMSRYDATPAHYRSIIPDPFWWKIIYIYGQLSTTSAPGARTPEITIVSSTGKTVLITSQAGTVDHDSTFQMWFAPDISAMYVANQPNIITGVAPIPELVWQHGTQFKLDVIGDSGADDWITAPVIAVQQYTEYRPGGAEGPAQLLPVST